MQKRCTARPVTAARLLLLRPAHGLSAVRSPLHVIKMDTSYFLLNSIQCIFFFIFLETSVSFSKISLRSFYYCLPVDLCGLNALSLAESASRPRIHLAERCTDPRKHRPEEAGVLCWGVLSVSQVLRMDGLTWMTVSSSCRRPTSSLAARVAPSLSAASPHRLSLPV